MSDQIRWQHVTIQHDGGVLRASGTHIDWIDIQTALYFHFGKLRGWEIHPVTYKTPAPVARVERTPRTTYGDVAQLAVFWTAELAKAKKARPEMNSRRERWKAAVDEVRALSEGQKATDLYPKNRTFWRAMQGVAIACDVERDMAERPTRLDAIVGFFTDTIPDAVGDALEWVGGKLEAGASAAGRALGGAARGVFDGLGVKPILIGAGVLAGAAIVVPAMSKRQGAKKGGAS